MKVVIGCFLALIVIILISIFEVWVVMCLWNWLIPMFWASAPILSFAETFGVLILLNIIAAIFKNMK